MSVTEYAQKYREKMDTKIGSFFDTDPEFMKIYSNFALDEVVNQDGLDGKTRFLAILASLVGCGAREEFREIISAALNFDVTPIEIKEMVYQSVAYLGFGRTLPFLRITNEVFQARGIELPLKGQSTTTIDTRLEKGIEAQVQIFGESMKDFYRSGDIDSRHIHRWLTENCFGDYYTRGGLTHRQREMITFCFLMAQGGCEPQLISHARANMLIGNEKQFLISIISTCIPYLGYPRCLNALECVNKIEEIEETQ